VAGFEPVEKLVKNERTSSEAIESICRSLYASRNRVKRVVDVRHKFARKRYAREYLWQPSPEIEAAIWKEIFGRFETDKS